MNKYKVLGLLVCEDCGKKFFGLYGKYCDECRKRRRQRK